MHEWKEQQLKDTYSIQISSIQSSLELYKEVAEKVNNISHEKETKHENSHSSFSHHEKEDYFI